MNKADTGSRQPWIWLLVLFTGAGFFETAFFGQMNAFTPLYLPKLGIAPDRIDDWTGWTVAFANLFGIFFLPFWGTLADRYSRKPVIVRSFLAHIVAIGLMMAAGNIWVFVIGRAAMNLALGNTGLMMTTLSERVPSNRIGLAFSIVNGAPPVGAFVAPLVGGRILDQWGFHALLSVNAVLMLMVVAALTLGYRDSFKGKHSGPLLGMAVDSVRMVFRSPRLRALFPALFVLFSGWLLAFTYLSLVVTSLHKGPNPGTVVGAVAAAGGFAALIFSPIVGAMADRWGYWRMLIIGAGVEVLLWPLPALAWNLVLFTVAWAVLNGVLTAVFSISFVVLSSSAPDEVRGRMMSFAYLPINVGLILGPVLASLVVNRFGVMAVFPLSSLLTLVSIGLLAYAFRQPAEAPARQHFPDHPPVA